MNKTYDENKQQKIRKQQQEKKAPETSKQPFLHHLQQRMGNQAVQRLIAQRAGKGTSTLDEQTEKKIQQAKQSGQGMDAALQQEMEQKIGQPLRDVRLHTDSEANQLNQQLGARAFTVGKDIFFRSGTFDPNSQQGQQLLAHELTHVHQQESGKVENGGEGLTVRPSGDQYEQEADAVAHQVVKPNASGPALAGNAIQRESHWDEDLINAMNVGPHSSAPNRSSSEIAQAPAHNPNEVTPTERPQERNHTAEIAQAPANVITQAPSNSENEVTPTERPQERNHTAEIAQAPSNITTQKPPESNSTAEIGQIDAGVSSAKAGADVITQTSSESTKKLQNSEIKQKEKKAKEKPLPKPEIIEDYMAHHKPPPGADQIRPTGDTSQHAQTVEQSAQENTNVNESNSTVEQPTNRADHAVEQTSAAQSPQTAVSSSAPAPHQLLGEQAVTTHDYESMSPEDMRQAIHSIPSNISPRMQQRLAPTQTQTLPEQQVRSGAGLSSTANYGVPGVSQSSPTSQYPTDDNADWHPPSYEESRETIRQDAPNEEEEVQMARENSSSDTLQANFLTDQFENMWNTGKKYSPDSVKNMAGKAKKNITDKVGKAKKTAGGIWDNIGSLVGNKTESVGDIIKNSTGGSFNQTEGEIPAEGKNQGWSQNEGSLDEEVQMQEEEEIVQCQEEWPEEEEVQLSEADAEEELVQCQEEEELAQFKLESSGGESLQMQGMEEYEKLMMGGEKEKFNKKEGDIPWWKRIWGFNS